MKQEIKKITGEIQNIRKDRKALQIEEIWYQSNFNPIDESINKGDNIIIEYTEKGDFKNIKSINFSQDNSEIIEAESKSIKLRDSTTINNLVMCSKDICISNKIKLSEATKQVLESYKQIRDSLSS